MQHFEGKVAVVTGAASGIGRGLAGRFARAGMKVALADIEREPLAIAERELASTGAEVIAVLTDVSSLASVEGLRDRVLERWGKVHVLCNNAGVSGGGGGPIWSAPERDWLWVLGVNLMGVVHGIQAFVPSMLAHGEEGHIALLVRAGIPASDVLQSATRLAARTMRRDHEIGTIEAGKVADIVVLEADPLADIEATRSAHLVIKDGRVHRPEDVLARIDTSEPDVP